MENLVNIAAVVAFLAVFCVILPIWVLRSMKPEDPPEKK